MHFEALLPPTLTPTNAPTRVLHHCHTDGDYMSGYHIRCTPTQSYNGWGSEAVSTHEVRQGMRLSLEDFMKLNPGGTSARTAIHLSALHTIMQDNGKLARVPSGAFGLTSIQPDMDHSGLISVRVHNAGFPGYHTLEGGSIQLATSDQVAALLAQVDQGYQFPGTAELMQAA